ncbi:DUF742 domain-containing protein [Streptomyces sp. NBC_01361]|uniref:DUF742 domain-containing protein n=1 Tax=Streptomyces sp. NBC_01361 TaxID=2903838 RepID=UPI002E365416|nr:DUF742 domain-containing protein [Streptomyces sp. NBC_01361]
MTDLPPGRRPAPDAADGDPDPWTDRYDAEAGPLVRLYAMTAGRARTDNGAERVDLMAIVRSTAATPRGPIPPEQRSLLAQCAQGPRPVADLASDSGLPLGVVRVLLGDLTAQGLIRIAPPESTAAGKEPVSAHLLREVINGLRAL